MTYCGQDITRVPTLSEHPESEEVEDLRAAEEATLAKKMKVGGGMISIAFEDFSRNLVYFL